MMSDVPHPREAVRHGGALDRLVGLILFLRAWQRALLAIASGALCTLALPPFNFPAVGFVGFPMLVWLLDAAIPTRRRSALSRFGSAFSVGWLFGFGYFIAGLWWLGAAMMVDAAEFAVFIPFAVLVLPAICAIYFGLATALARLFWSDSAFRILSLAGSLALFEYLRAVLFTGFPWNEIGLMAAPVPLMMQSATLFGIHGLTLIAVIVFASPAVLPDHHGRARVLALALALLVFHLGYGAIRLATHPTRYIEDVNVRVVQPNIEQAVKWDEGEAQRIFDRHLKLTEMRADPASIVGARKPAAGSNGGEADDTPAVGINPDGRIPDAADDAPVRTLVIWPETSFPFFLTQRPEAIAQISDVLRPGETLIAGAARVEGDGGPDPRYYNSVYVIDDNGEIVDARDKVHLVPFGEYLPFQGILEKFGMRQIADALPGGFSPGAPRQKVLLEGAPSFLPLICYEIIFPGEVDVGTSETRPGFLVNDTNDAWYGDTPGPHQHLQQAELTAVSFGLPLVRSANTGVSVVTDAYGREIGGLALGSTGTIEVALPAAAKATPFARFGILPFFFAIVLNWMIVIVMRLRMRAWID